jgi:hypothetical protein
MPLPVEDLWNYGIAKALGPGAGEEQCLGVMPWICRATAIEPDANSLMQTVPKVKQCG